MKLSELVNAYKGEVRFDVNRIVDYNDEDVIVFKGDEAGAIKDTILNVEVNQFTVTEGDNPPAVDGGENKGENGSEQGDEATG